MERLVSSTSRDPPGEDAGTRTNGLTVKCINNNVNPAFLKCQECDEAASNDDRSLSSMNEERRNAEAAEFNSTSEGSVTEPSPTTMQTGCLGLTQHSQGVRDL